MDLLAVALLVSVSHGFTASDDVYNDPTDVWGSIASCDAYPDAEDMAACVDEMITAWEPWLPVTLDGGAPYALRPTVELRGPENGAQPIQAPLETGRVEPIRTKVPHPGDLPWVTEWIDGVPVVSDNLVTYEDDSYSLPSWCGFEGWGHAVEHSSGLDWSEVTESWTGEQVDACF